MIEHREAWVVSPHKTRLSIGGLSSLVQIGLEEVLQSTVRNIGMMGWEGGAGLGTISGLDAALSGRLEDLAPISCEPRQGDCQKSVKFRNGNLRFVSATASISLVCPEVEFPSMMKAEEFDVTQRKACQDCHLQTRFQILRMLGDPQIK